MLKALIVEDEDIARAAVEALLRGMGATQVDTAADGSRARERLVRGAGYDLLVCDLRLPGLDGVEFLREVARCQPGVAVILISGAEDSIVRSVAVLARERGLRVLGALRKPVGKEALAQLVERLIAPPAPRAPALAPVTGDQVARAIHQRTLGALVQPKVRVSDAALHSAEVLLRGRDGAAADLLRAAERGGQGWPLSQYMLGLGLHACADWQAQGLTCPVAVNLCSEALLHPDLPEHIERLQTAGGLQPEHLIIELAEGPQCDEVAALENLSRLRLRGVRVSLDNGGGGNSSPTRLQRLPLTELKIDRRHVAALVVSMTARTVVEYTIRLARSLGIDSVAVGVENAAQREILEDLGCDILQGNLLSAPMEPDALPAWGAMRQGSITQIAEAA